MAAARAEVVGLHEFFVGWFTGKLDCTDAVFARFAAVLHPDFSMVVPSGETLDRGAVVASVRSAHDTAGDALAIEIRSFVERFVSDSGVLVTYEECQLEGDRLLNRRASTAYFVTRPEAPNGLQWRHLHETLRQG